MDLIKYDMTDIWAVAGDVVAPDSAKIRAGWGIEVVPRQWWNWFENRQDNNIAYMLQKGFAEWDATTEYIINKSYVQRNGIVYKATATSTNSDPINLTSWVRAFPESTPYLETIKGLTVTPDTFSYINTLGNAANVAISAYTRGGMNVADAVAARTYLNAQAFHSNLTALSSVTASTNALPYFTGTTTMGVTTFTSFARSLLDDVDAVAARATLGLGTAATANTVTSEVDSTVGRVLTVGSFGIGSPTTAVNIDDLLSSGIYQVKSTSGGTYPVGFSNGSVIVSQRNVSPYRSHQILTSDSDGRVWRRGNGGSWGTWLEIYAGTQAVANGGTGATDALNARINLGADNATNLTTGTLPLARLPADLTGKNAATATALQTARTIQGVSFNGTANITLSVVDKDSPVGSATLPAGTTAQRTASAINGMIRYNNDLGVFEGYQAGGWATLGNVDTTVYKRSNVLGTVSQSAGVPTGALIERGSNANGSYVKFADGTMICTSLRGGVAQDVIAATGGLFTAGSELSWTYPATFVSTPNVSSVCVRNEPEMVMGVFHRSVTNISTNWRIWSSAINLAGNVKDVYITAIGRWF